MKLIKSIAVASALGLFLLGAMVCVAGDTGTTPTTPVRVRPTLPDDVKALVDKLKTDREAFAKEQAAVLKTLRDATKEQRDKIREQLQDNREAFLDQQKALREQIKDRLEELRKEFKDNRDKILEEVKDKRQDAKERRGGN